MAKTKNTRKKIILSLLTILPALIGAALSIYHLAVVASDLNDSHFFNMLAGEIGSFYLAYDYLIMLLPINLCYLVSWLFNFFGSRLLGRAWSISVLCSLGWIVVAGAMAGFRFGSGLLFTSLLLAIGAASPTVAAVFLSIDLTKLWQNSRKKTKQK